MSSAAAMKRVCPLLEKETPTKVLAYASAPWVLKQCLETDFVFLENPPEYEAFKEDYAWEVTSKKESDARQTAEPMAYAVSTGLKNFRRQVLKRNKIRALSHAYLDQPAQRQSTGPLNLLDMGCGWGGLLLDVVSTLPPELAKRCAPFGIELSKELAHISNERLAAAGGGCVHDTALNGLTHFPENHFHLIIMSSFLEHEINPLPLLRRCHQHMKAGGQIIVKVPNYACFNRTVRGERWCGFRWPDHVNYFTPRTLREMVESAGLRIARMNFFDRHPFSDNMYAVLEKPA